MREDGQRGADPFLAVMSEGTGPVLPTMILFPHPLTDLEIKVSNLLGMKVVHTIQDLLDEAGGLFLTQRLLLGQEVKELSSRHSARHQWWGGGQAVGAAPNQDPNHLDIQQDPLTHLWGSVQPAPGTDFASIYCILPFGS